MNNTDCVMSRAFFFRLISSPESFKQGISDLQKKYPGIPWYDIQEIIEASLFSLEAFQFLVEARYDAGYVRKEKMGEYFAAGARYWLDTCGNCGILIGHALDELFPDASIPRVFRREERKAILQNLMDPDDPEQNRKVESMSWHYGMCKSLPPHNIFCPFCRVGFNVGNAHACVALKSCEIMKLDDFIGKTLRDVRAFLKETVLAVKFISRQCSIRNDRFINKSPMYPNPKDEWERKCTLVKNERGWVGENEGITDDYIIQEGDEADVSIEEFYHPDCNSKKLERDMNASFSEIFKKAGFVDFSLTPIKNEYGSGSWRGPWFNVKTEFGTFTIGWRKRVISIQWPEFKNDQDKQVAAQIFFLFDGEDVTKNLSLIHAWSEEKAVEYLGKIRILLSTLRM